MLATGPTDEEKRLLFNLVYTSTLDEAGRQTAIDFINGCTCYKVYQRIQYRLEALQTPLDQIPNPAQWQINKHLRQSIF